MNLFLPFTAKANLLKTGLQMGPLAHWNYLPANKKRDFTGNVYDKNIVKRVYPSEVEGWEHGKSTPSLVQVAKNDAWEKCAIPPVLLYYTPNKTPSGCHYVVADGHHRRNAASEAKSGFPAMVIGTWTQDKQGNYFDLYRRPYNSVGKGIFPKKWNPNNVLQRVFVNESIKERNIWGTKEITMTLKGERIDEKLNSITSKLNKFKKLSSFLNPNKEKNLIVRISIDNGRMDHLEGYKHQTISLKANPSDNWGEILKENTTFRNLLNMSKKAQTGIINIQIQQGSFFISESL